MTTFQHQPVLLREVLTALTPCSGGRYVDGTLGRAGHAEAILEASSPEGWLMGLDRDETAIEEAQKRLSRFGDRVDFQQGNFADMENWVPQGSCDGILLDLGVSSPQLDDASRGFSFMREGPLDMRMDRTQELSAANLVNESDEEELAQIFYEFGEERQSRKIAKAIVAFRQVRPFETTRQLAELIAKHALSQNRKIHPATKVFQALRMAVNDELGSIEAGLEASWRVLKKGGRLAVITFHSLEDRMVKHFGRDLERDYEFTGEVDVPELRTPKVPELKWVSRKAIQPTEEEVSQNPRARSAQLRVMEKIN